MSQNISFLPQLLLLVGCLTTATRKVVTVYPGHGHLLAPVCLTVLGFVRRLLCGFCCFVFLFVCLLRMVMFIRDFFSFIENRYFFIQYIRIMVPLPLLLPVLSHLPTHLGSPWSKKSHVIVIVSLRNVAYKLMFWAMDSQLEVQNNFEGCGARRWNLADRSRPLGWAFRRLYLLRSGIPASWSTVMWTNASPP